MHMIPSMLHSILAITSLCYVTWLQLGCAQWPQNVTAASTPHLHLPAPLHLCDKRGENDAFLKLVAGWYNVSCVDICKVSCRYSPALTLIHSTGQFGQHQHHPAVFPWSPPAVSRGIAPRGRAGRPAGVKSGRWVSYTGSHTLEDVVTLVKLGKLWNFYFVWCLISDILRYLLIDASCFSIQPFNNRTEAQNHHSVILLITYCHYFNPSHRLCCFKYQSILINSQPHHLTALFTPVWNTVCVLNSSMPICLASFFNTIQTDLNLCLNRKEYSSLFLNLHVSFCFHLTEIYDKLCARGEEPDLLSVLTVLASTVIPGLPPGGGIQSK